jgi:hypothetical protein
MHLTHIPGSRCNLFFSSVCPIGIGNTGEQGLDNVQLEEQHRLQNDTHQSTQQIWMDGHGNDATAESRASSTSGEHDAVADDTWQTFDSNRMHEEQLSC